MKLLKQADGAGGKAMQEFLNSILVPAFTNRRINDGLGIDDFDDGASFSVENYDIVVSTDGHTVQPTFFPGGNIGTLAAAGTINDVAMMGAKPIAMTDAIMAEEGFPVEDFKKILDSINDVVVKCNVAIIAGDTKIMPKGTLDKIVIATTGIGIAKKGTLITDHDAKPGDVVIVSGPIGDHGTVLLAHREGLAFDTNLKSDVKPLWPMIEKILPIGGIHVMKDPTRGGFSAAINEIASKSNVEIELYESEIPIREPVRALSEILGLDPLMITSEGIAIIIVEKEKSDEILNMLHQTPEGNDAKIIGHVKEGVPGRVVMLTEIGGKRLVQMPYGELIPRVC